MENLDTTSDTTQDTKPDNLPEKFFDKEKNAVRTDALLKSYLELEKKLAQSHRRVKR